MISKYLEDFFNKYPAASHVIFLIVAGSVAIYNQSPAAQHDVALLVTFLTVHIPYGKTVVAVLSFAFTWYYKHEK